VSNIIGRIGANCLRIAAAVGLLAMLMLPCQSNAAEGGYSNYVPGTYGDFGMALAPTEKWTLRNDVYHYGADTNRAVISGDLKEELDLKFLLNFTTLLYKPDIVLFGAQYAGGIFVTTVVNQEIKEKVSSSTGTRSARDSTSGQGDLTFIPFSLYWQKDNLYWTVSQFIVAPTASYDVEKVMNTSLNYWSFDNNFALEYFNPKTGWDLAFDVGYIYNTENHTTDYHTGQELHLDFVINHFFSKSFAVGLQGFALK